MGCCMSNERVNFSKDTNTVFEVTIDEQGKAHRVAEGEGTHIIRITPDQGEILERK
ncbi:hypothetical protein BDF20DRAFT_807110, partial [Mycotypha africana]|uniref:uncharacterized protein n=1 Tax=Mycotypha africana TaxID=64632 RepID=UPI0023006C09